jgi:hypothetical protein
VDLVTTSLEGTLTVLINTIGRAAPPSTSLKLSATFSSQNNIVLSWLSSATNVVVQTNSQLAGTNWGPLNSAISVNNGTNMSSVAPGPANLFFRLKQ